MLHEVPAGNCTDDDKNSNDYEHSAHPFNISALAELSFQFMNVPSLAVFYRQKRASSSKENEFKRLRKKWGSKRLDPHTTTFSRWATSRALEKPASWQTLTAKIVGVQSFNASAV
jgi:hypothetical protein